jgi:hypothetical protein
VIVQALFNSFSLSSSFFHPSIDYQKLSKASYHLNSSLLYETNKIIKQFALSKRKKSKIEALDLLKLTIFFEQQWLR